MRNHDDVKTVTIEVGGLPFAVEVSAEGIRGLGLPPLTADVERLAGRSPAGCDTPALDGEEKRHVDDLATFLAGILAGKAPGRRPPVDLKGQTPFTVTVLEVVGRIPWGSVTSYGDVAVMAGCRGSARAVGGAVGRNPVPLVIPCHRIVRADGSAGGWSGQPGWKEWLLELESTKY